MQKIHLFKCKNYIYFGVKITSYLVLKIHFFTVIHKYYSGYLHALFQCKKDSRSTWDLRTHVKSVFFTADIFAVYSEVPRAIICLSSWWLAVSSAYGGDLVSKEVCCCCLYVSTWVNVHTGAFCTMLIMVQVHFLT